MLAIAVGKADPNGLNRKSILERGKALAEKSSFNKLELTPVDADFKSLYKKIVLNTGSMDNLLVGIFLESQREMPEEIILDVDATDAPLHGNQEGKFFHDYYKTY